MLLRIEVRDESGELVPCRIQVKKVEMGPDGLEMDLPAMQEGAAFAFRSIRPIRDVSGILDMSPHQMACCLGTHVFAVPEGTYEVTAARGLLYQPANRRIEASGSAVSLELRLIRLFDPKSWGLWSFDGHSHVSRDDASTAGTLAGAILAMRCEDFNFFFPGAPYDVENHCQYLSGNFPQTIPYRTKYESVLNSMRTADFIPDIGNELYKGRYGHAFLMNFTQYPPYSRYYDETYDVWQFGKVGREPALEIPYLHEAMLAERTPHSVAVLAHPTSWWTDQGQFITNIATTVGFDVLAGTVDALVVLGYRRDCPQYQALWFELLNNGYRIPGIAETDEVFDRPPEGKIRFKTYAVANGEGASAPSLDVLCEAIRAGQCIASSGPVLSVKVDGHLPGSTLPLGEGRTIHIEAACRACCEGPLTRLQIIRNGIVTDEYPLTGNEASVTHVVRMEQNGWILAKCLDAAGNTAISNPVYIRNGPFRNDGYHASVHVRVTCGGIVCRGTHQVDEDQEYAFQDSFQLSMRPSSVLRIRSDGLVKEIRLIELPALQDVFRSLYLGSFNTNDAYSSGEVPVEAFQIARIREVLDAVELEVEMRP